jgi:transcriptional regulator with XRE-family HTH domain
VSKRDQLEPQARDMRVIHGMTYTDIAARLGISLRTVQTWAKDNASGRGTWDQQRASLTSSADTFHAELYDLGIVVARTIKDNLLEGRPVDKTSVANLDRIVKTALNAHKYQLKNPPKAGPVSPNEQRHQLQAKIRERLGLKAAQ